MAGVVEKPKLIVFDLGGDVFVSNEVLVYFTFA
jgi:hypothetical protein